MGARRAEQAAEFGSKMWRRVSGDTSRQVLTGAAAAAEVILPTLVMPRFAREHQPPDVITPAPYAFGIWFPIFAASVGYAGLQARPGSRTSGLAREIGWPVAAASASTGVWAPLVKNGKYWSAQSALAGIAVFAEIARRRLARTEPSDADPALRGASTLAVGMLSAWGATATGVNLAAMLVDAGLVRTPNARAALGSGLLLGLGAAGATATGATMEAAPTLSRVYAFTLVWGLTGVVVGQRRRSPPAAVAAVVATLPVVLAATRRGPSART